MLDSTRVLRDFHRQSEIGRAPSVRQIPALMYEKPRPARVSSKIMFPGCTVSGHLPVHGVHSIEKACTYKGVFSIDSKNRKSKNRIVL
jgi:hypothetical protein